MKLNRTILTLNLSVLALLGTLKANEVEEHNHSHDAHDSYELHDDDSHNHHNHSHHYDSYFSSRYNYLHTYESHAHAESKQVDFASLSAKIGIFGKTSILADKNHNANRDNYAMLYSNILLQSAPFANMQNALSGFVLGLGAVAYAPFYDKKAIYINHSYIQSYFVANTAYLGYVKDFDGVGVEFRAGRFDTELEWVGHSLQGVFARLTLPFDTHTPHSAQIYGIWVNDQSHTMREMSTDFNLYKALYPKENLFAGGVNLSFGITQHIRIHLEPYAYYLSDYFGIYGGKVVLDIGFGGEEGNSWRSKTIAHSAFLYSNYARIHAGHNMMGQNHTGHSHDGHFHLDTDNRGDTYFVFVEQEFGYEDWIYFGAGFQHIGAHVFEIANLGGTSRFEAHEGAGFGVIRPGAVHSGSQITNAYDAHTNTYYGFLGAQFGEQKQFALEAMGRDSRSSARAQSAFSLGLRYAFPYGFEIGGIGVFMLDKHQHANETMLVNRSFGKAYVQWSF